MESAVKQRLVQFIKMMHLTQRGFEELCGMGNGYVNSIRKGIGPEKMQSIIRVFPQLNREWLLYGEGEMLKSAPTVQQNIVHGDNNYNNGVIQIGPARAELCPQCGVNTVPPAYIKIPDRIIYAPETNVTEWVENNLDSCETIDFLKILDPRTLKVQRINTRAMEPWISEGTFLFTRYIPEWKRLLFDGTLYGIDLDYPHMIIRRVYDDGENIKCVPINPDYAPIIVPRERVLGVYEIVASLKMLRKTL